jgi:dinuclear metal center YbgI/SA1388 family protein
MNDTIGQVINYLEEQAPAYYQESYDNAGLLIGNRNTILQKGLICLDVTQAVFDEAVETGVNFIIAHHPLIFTPLKKITGKTLCEQIIMQAIKKDIAIYAIHTNLDNMLHGVNAYFADKLHLHNRKILRPSDHSLRKIVTYIPDKQADIVRNALFAAGAGKIGNYDACSYNSEGFGTFRANEKANPFVGKKHELHREDEIKVEVVFPVHLQRQITEALYQNHPYEEPAYDIIALENTNPYIGSGVVGELETETSEMDFLQFLKKQMQLSCVKYSKLSNKMIRKVAVCGGSGSFLISEAIRLKADVFVTSELKHNHFIELAEKILLADIGHFESEIQTKQLLFDVLNKKFSNFATSEREQNPISYL